MAKYAAAVDQGTTSTRFMIFDHAGKVVGVDQKEHEQIYPKPGWVEHNPMEIWERTQEVIAGALKKSNVDPKDIAAVGVTNQRETTVVWEKATGKPIYNAIVWQDTRTDTICNELAKDGGQDRFRPKVGLPLATYFSGPKIKWILDNVEGARAKAEKGEILFGNIDTWVIWNLTGGPAGTVAQPLDAAALAALQHIAFARAEAQPGFDRGQNIAVEVRPGETLEAAVLRSGVAPTDARLAGRVLAQAMDTVNIRAGMDFVASVAKPHGRRGPARLIGLSMRTGAASTITVTRPAAASGVSFGSDKFDQPIALFPNDWTMRYFVEKNPELKLHDLPLEQTR